MKLPKRELPIYTTYLPASDISVKYRPHTVKEEQILNMASMGDDDQEKLDAVFQICENCTEYDVATIFPAEVEYIFMKIKACSDTPKIPVVYNIDPVIDPVTGINKHADCGDVISTTFDINTDVEIVMQDMDQFAKRNKDGSWIVDLQDGIKMQVRVKPLTEVNESSIYELVESIIDEVEDTVMYKEIDFNSEEFTEWVSTMPSTAFSDFKKFMDNTPSCVAHLTFKCKCGEVIEEDEYGVLRFLV
jgi:hypothetical protein